jgi:hypothetical protein
MLAMLKTLRDREKQFNVKMLFSSPTLVLVTEKKIFFL